MSIPIITLTTDLGDKDYYVPSAKGYLWSKLPGANITDITHQIKPFRIDDASFILKGCFEDFPAGSIHIISVDSGNTAGNRYIAAKAKSYFFICPDNGIVSLLVEEEEIEQVISLPFEDKDLISPLKNILVPAAVHIALNGNPDALGKEIKDFVRKANLRPLIEESIIRGAVIYIDNLGNAITNIDKTIFDRFSKGRKHHISFSSSDYFEKISLHYNEVPEGEKVCLFGTNGLLEIAINKGSCTNLLGIKTGHVILIEFL